MSIATAITDLSGRIQNAYDALEAKGAIMPATKNTTNLSACINSIPGSSLYGIPSLKNTVGENVNGTLTLPSTPYALDMSGIKVIPANGLQYKFFGQRVSSVSFPDLETIGEQGLYLAFYKNTPMVGSDRQLSITFPKLTSIGDNALYGVFQDWTDSNSATAANFQFNFPAIENITANNVFQRIVFTPNLPITWDTLTFNFASLKTISGTAIFRDAHYAKYTTMSELARVVINMPEVTSITCGTTSAQSWFTGLTTSRIEMYLPKCTSITNDVIAPSQSHITYHFGEANQSAIEATTGYANKWCSSSAANAQVLFDL